MKVYDQHDDFVFLWDYSIHGGFSRLPLTLGLEALGSKPLILHRIEELRTNYTYQNYQIDPLGCLLSKDCS